MNTLYLLNKNINDCVHTMKQQLASTKHSMCPDQFGSATRIILSSIGVGNKSKLYVIAEKNKERGKKKTGQVTLDEKMMVYTICAQPLQRDDHYKESFYPTASPGIS